MSKNGKIVKYRRGINFDIGFFIFLIIIVYVLYHFFTYIISSPIAEYEVRHGTIATNNVYHGLILRDETVEYSDAAGRVNYYVANNSKASIRDVIYSIDTNGSISDKIDSAVADGSSLDSTSISEIEESLDSFITTYDSQNYAEAYSFKQRLASEITQSLSAVALNHLNSEVSNAVNNNTFFTNKSLTPGIISYYIDGYEAVTADNFTADNFNGTSYKRENLTEQREVEVLSPVYKRINSENWNIIIAVPDTVIERLAEKSYVKIRFTNDDFEVTVAFEVIQREDGYYLNLKLNNSLIRYINSRFIDVELILDNISGLKIPVSAITTKSFFTIPKEYFTTGGDSKNAGLIVKNSSKDGSKDSFVSPVIYYENDEFYYIDSEDISATDILIKPNSSETYVAGTQTGELLGVYNINKGYAVFKQINILSQNDDYAIIETKTEYGLSLYDHIALDGSKVTENQTVTN